MNVAYTGNSLAKRTVTADAISLGRFMSSQSVSGTSTLRTSGADTDFTRVTVNGTTFDAAGKTSAYTLTSNTYAQGAVSGTVALSATGEGLTGEGAYSNVNVAYTGASVGNRVVTASSVNLGKLLVGVTASGTSNLTTSGDNDHFTSITVDGQTFNSAGSTGTHIVNNKSFATSGTSQSSTDAATVLGEGLTGESVQGVSATYTANVFQTALLSGSATAATKTTASNLNLTNAASSDGGQRAGVTVTGLTASNSATGRSSNFATPSLSGTPSVGTTTNAVSTATVGTVALQGKRLNGSYSETVTAAAQYTDTTLRTQGTVADQSFTVTASISGNASTSATDIYSADILGGQSFNGYGLTSGVSGGKAGPTVATLLGGTAGANTTVNMSFSSTLGAAGTDSINRQSDILTLSGINVSDTFVLQMSYDPNAPAGDKYIVVFNTTLHRWVNANSGNSDPATSSFLDGGQGIGNYVLGNYDSSYTLGYYGYNAGTKTAWAVLDNTNGAEFAVVPEPSTWAMLVGGLGMLGFVQRLRRRVAH